MFKILLIDDTRAVHIYTKSILSKVPDVTLVEAYNGQEGINLLLQEGDIDLILLDWEMPVMNGIQTLEQLRHIKDTPPVIMATTRNNPGDIEIVLGLGASDYMMKPFTFDVLCDKIEMVSGKKISASLPKTA